MLPAGPPPWVGRSSLATSSRTVAIRPGLGARTISELLRESIITATLVAPPIATAWPGTPGNPVPSASRCTIGARSAATAYCSGMTSMSDALGVSSAATILASRCRLSA